MMFKSRLILHVILEAVLRIIKMPTYSLALSISANYQLEVWATLR